MDINSVLTLLNLANLFILFNPKHFDNLLMKSFRLILNKNR